MRAARRPLLHAAAAVVVTGVTIVAAGQLERETSKDYPQWRGRLRDGAASAFVVPSAWPDKLTRRWKVDVGEGYATPIVIGSVVYEFTRRGDEEMLLALDAETGQEKWRTTYPAPFLPSRAAVAHGAGPKATPLYHNGKLFTLGISGIVSAFDASTGKRLWQKPAPKDAPFFGTAVSPLGEQDLVLVHPADYGPLTAYDANTGTVKWIGPENGTFASPVIVDVGGVRHAVTMTQHSVIGVSLTDGALLWRVPWETKGTPSAITPVAYADTIIVSSHNMGVKAIKPVLRDGKWTATIAWDNQDVSLFMSNPVLVGDTLYGLSHKASGQLFALDAKTGKTLWLGEPREATNTAFVKAGDLLFLLNDDAELIVAKSNPARFEPLHRYTVAESSTWAQPTISGNRLFVKDVSSLTLWTLN